MLRLVAIDEEFSRNELISQRVLAQQEICLQESIESNSFSYMKNKGAIPEKKKLVTFIWVQEII